MFNTFLRPQLRIRAELKLAAIHRICPAPPLLPLAPPQGTADFSMCQFRQLLQEKTIHCFLHCQGKFLKESQVNVYHCQKDHPSPMPPKSWPHLLTEPALELMSPMRQFCRHAWQKTKELHRKEISWPFSKLTHWIRLVIAHPAARKSNGLQVQRLLSVGNPRSIGCAATWNPGQAAWLGWSKMAGRKHYQVPERKLQINNWKPGYSWRIYLKKQSYIAKKSFQHLFQDNLSYILH